MEPDSGADATAEGGPALPSTPRNRPVTINDVAAATGVAASTVSRALSRPGRVNVHTRERIEAAAKALNYVPNSQARALTSGRTRTVALLVSDVTNPFYFGIVRGTQRELRAAGYAHLLIDTEDSGEVETEMLHRMRRSLDGAILAASRLPARALAALAAEIPLVAINRNVRGVQSVVIDTPSGIRHATEHLVSLGHRDIVYVSGPERSWPNEARWHAIRAAAGHGVSVRRIGPFPPERPAGSAAADAVLNTGATACVVFNDLLAIGMLTRLRQRGRHVPRDMSVVGCDDIFGADFCHPPLTTLAAPIDQAGRVAVTMLLSRLGERNADHTARRSVVLPTHLTIRESTGPAPSSRPAPSRRSRSC